MPRWRVRIDTAGFVMSSSLDEQALAFVSEGIRALAGEDRVIEVEGHGPEGFIRAVLEVDAETGGAAAMEVDLIVRHALRIASEEHAIDSSAARVERLAVARAPVGDE